VGLIPGAVSTLLAGIPTPGVADLVLPLLTTDADGYPHVCLLSRAEVEADRHEVRVAVTSRRTRANLQRDGRACLVVAEADAATAHYLKLQVARCIEVESRLALALVVVDHTPDSLGIPLEPMRFVPNKELMESEGWAANARALAAIRG